MAEINFTRHDRDALRALYENAVENGEEFITFQGEQLLTAYTKYLLEYLDHQTFV